MSKSTNTIVMVLGGAALLYMGYRAWLLDSMAKDILMGRRR